MGLLQWSMRNAARTFVLLAVCMACNRSTGPEPSAGSARNNVASEASTPVPTEEEQPPAMEASTARSDADATHSPPQTRVAKGIGTKNLERLLAAKTAIVARLGTENPRIVEKTVLTDPQRIGGFPIVSDERTLSPDEAAELAKTMTNDSEYLDVRRRCKAKRRIGARFGEATSPERIEVNLSRTCDSLVFYWLDNGVAKSWGQVVSLEMAESFEKVVSGN
jgi:hypothetical protein